MYHACNLSNRSPSQKLSKPVPTNGLLASRSTLCQTTVRPVRLGSLPNAPTRPPLESKNRANRLNATIPNTIRCTTDRFRKNVEKLVLTISAAAIRKQDSAVMELDLQKSQSVTASIAP